MYRITKAACLSLPESLAQTFLAVAVLPLIVIPSVAIARPTSLSCSCNVIATMLRSKSSTANKRRPRAITAIPTESTFWSSRLCRCPSERIHAKCICTALDETATFSEIKLKRAPAAAPRAAVQVHLQTGERYCHAKPFAAHEHGPPQPAPDLAVTAVDAAQTVPDLPLFVGIARPRLPVYQAADLRRPRILPTASRL